MEIKPRRANCQARLAVFIRQPGGLGGSGLFERVPSSHALRLPRVVQHLAEVVRQKGARFAKCPAEFGPLVQSP